MINRNDPVASLFLQVSPFEAYFGGENPAIITDIDANLSECGGYFTWLFVHCLAE